MSLTSGSDEQLPACDADGIEDGLTNFDLTLASPEFCQAIFRLTPMYYETYQDALLETKPFGDNLQIPPLIIKLFMPVLRTITTFWYQ